MLTDAEILALNKECLEKGRDLDYELGRETAKKYLANGTAGSIPFDVIEQVFGAAYAKGYTDYVTAFNILNRR
jgi:hypothetical protein